MKHSGIMVLLVWAVFADLPLYGQSEPELQDLDRQIRAKQGELENLREEIRLYERRIAEKEQAEVDALNTLFELEERISLTSRLVRALEEEIAQLSRAITLTEQGIHRGEEEIAELKEKLAARFVHIYKKRRATNLELILTSDNWNQASYRAKYLKVAADYDRYLTNKVKEDISRLEEQRQRLDQDRRRKQESIREKEREERDLQATRAQWRRQIDQIKQDRRNDERLLVEKRQAFVQLERIIAGLEYDRERRAQELAELRRQRALEEVANISLYMGKLPWPAYGEVVAHFGRQQHPELKTITDNPGIDIQAPAGSSVQAVLDGLVTTVTYIRGFGTTVIIDHGKELYTVYTHLENVAVSEGNYVDQGQTLGEVGSRSSLEGSRLHFEVWANRVKRDPEEWLVKLGTL